METLQNSRKQPTQAPVFIVGMWRSGTSLFYALLNQHPKIKLMYEDELPLLWPLFVGGSARPDWQARWEFWNRALSRHRIEVGGLPAQVSSLRQACEAAWMRYAPDAEVRGGKSPSYFDCLPRIAEEFPDAKFLVLWRDPADVCRSVVKARSDSFFGKRGMLLRALLGCRDLKRGYDKLASRGIQVYPVQYEDLVANPAAVMQGVCCFLEIEFDRQMTSLSGADRSAIYPSSHHDMVNSEKIVAAGPKPEVLPEDVRRKVARYVAFWKQESGGSWPRFPESSPAPPAAFFFFERLVDRIAYRGLRTFDHLVALMYCYLPIGLLRSYRASKAGAASEPCAETTVEDKELATAAHK